MEEAIARLLIKLERCWSGHYLAELAAIVSEVGSFIFSDGSLPVSFETFAELLKIKAIIHGGERSQMKSTWEAIDDFFSKLLAVDVDELYSRAFPFVVNNGIGTDKIEAFREQCKWENDQLDPRVDSRCNEYLCHLKDMLRIWIIIHGPKHPTVASAKHKIGREYAALGHHSMALTYFQEALEIWAEILGSYHPTVEKLLREMVRSKVWVDENWKNLYDRAEHIHDRLNTATRSKEALVDGPPAVVPDQNVTGTEAPFTMETAFHSLRMKLQQCGEEPLADIALVLKRMGDMRRHQGNATAAMMLYEDAHLTLLSSDYGPTYMTQLTDVLHAIADNHVQHAVNVVRSLGELYLSHGMHEEAALKFQEALSLQHQMKQEALSADMAALLHDLGRAYAGMEGRSAEAIAALNDALRMRVLVAGVKHEHVAAVLSDLATVHAARGEHTTALAYREEAAKIQETVHGIQHPDAVAAVAKLNASKAHVEELMLHGPHSSLHDGYRGTGTVSAGVHRALWHEHHRQRPKHQHHQAHGRAGDDVVTSQTLMSTGMDGSPVAAHAAALPSVRAFIVSFALQIVLVLVGYFLLRLLGWFPADGTDVSVLDWVTDGQFHAIKEKIVHHKEEKQKQKQEEKQRKKTAFEEVAAQEEANKKSLGPMLKETLRSELDQEIVEELVQEMYSDEIAEEVQNALMHEMALDMGIVGGWEKHPGTEGQNLGSLLKDLAQEYVVQQVEAVKESTPIDLQQEILDGLLKEARFDGAEPYKEMLKEAAAMDEKEGISPVSVDEAFIEDIAEPTVCREMMQELVGREARAAMAQGNKEDDGFLEETTATVPIQHSSGGGGSDEGARKQQQKQQETQPPNEDRRESPTSHWTVVQER